MRIYTILIEGYNKGGRAYSCTHLGIKGASKNDALLNLFRVGDVDPFLTDRTITISED